MSSTNHFLSGKVMTHLMIGPWQINECPTDYPLAKEWMALFICLPEMKWIHISGYEFPQASNEYDLFQAKLWMLLITLSWHTVSTSVGNCLAVMNTGGHYQSFTKVEILETMGENCILYVRSYLSFYIHIDTTIDKGDNKKCNNKEKGQSSKNKPNAIPAWSEWPNIVINKRGIWSNTDRRRKIVEVGLKGRRSRTQ